MARISSTASSSHGLIPSLPRPVWKLVSLHGLASLGAGIVFAFLTVYLHFVRGISLSDAGIAFAALPVGAMATGPVAGALADRLGPRYVIAGGGLLAAAAAAVLPFVTVAWQAVGVALVLGAGMTCLESPVYTLLATSVSKEQRSAVFALDYAVIALGWGAGGFVGGFVVNIGRVATFQSAFFIATGCFLVFAAAMATTTPPPASTLDDPPGATTPEVTGAGGYRSVVANRCMRRIMSLSVLLMAFAYVQFDVTFPAVAIGSAHVGTRVIGIAFFANMLTVAGGQLFVLRYLQGRRRTRAMVFMCLFPAGVLAFGARFDPRRRRAAGRHGARLVVRRRRLRRDDLVAERAGHGERPRARGRARPLQRRQLVRRGDRPPGRPHHGGIHARGQTGRPVADHHRRHVGGRHPDRVRPRAAGARWGQQDRARRRGAGAPRCEVVRRG